MIRFATGALVVLAAAAAAWGDEVQLTNGRKLEGIIIADRKQPTKVVLEVGAGIVVLDSKEVSSVAKGRTLLHEYYERWDGVKESRKARDFHDLAVWAREGKLVKFVRPLCEKAIALEPDHAGARKDLGYSRVGGKWLTHEEAMTASGMVPFEGRWISPAEKALIEKGRLEAKERRMAADAERERRRVEDRERREKVLQEQAEALRQMLDSPYGYYHRPSWFWPFYYRPHPWAPTFRNRERRERGYEGGFASFSSSSFVPLPFPFLFR